MLFSHVEGPHLNNGSMVFLASCSIYVFRAISIHVPWSIVSILIKFLVEGSHDEIEDRNDVSRVVFNLPVESIIELKNVVAVDIEDVLLGLMDLSQPLNVERLLPIVLVVVQADESGEEVV